MADAGPVFVDTNVFMYAVGGDHPLKQEARSFFLESLESGTPLVTSAEVLQELMHEYVSVGRLETLDAALVLVRDRAAEIWPVQPADVAVARSLVDRQPALGARDLLHLASCLRRDVERVRTFDRALASAFE